MTKRVMEILAFASYGVVNAMWVAFCLAVGVLLTALAIWLTVVIVPLTWIYALASGLIFPSLVISALVIISLWLAAKYKSELI